jgi:hypothetical protein
MGHRGESARTCHDWFDRRVETRRAPTDQSSEWSCRRVAAESGAGQLMRRRGAKLHQVTSGIPHPAAPAPPPDPAAPYGVQLLLNSLWPSRACEEPPGFSDRALGGGMRSSPGDRLMERGTGSTFRDARLRTGKEQHAPDHVQFLLPTMSPFRTVMAAFPERKALLPCRETPSLQAAPRDPDYRRCARISARDHGRTLSRRLHGS